VEEYRTPLALALPLLLYKHYTLYLPQKVARKVYKRCYTARGPKFNIPGFMYGVALGTIKIYVDVLHGDDTCCAWW
jgi:hypothetical protein